MKGVKKAGVIFLFFSLFLFLSFSFINTVAVPGDKFILGFEAHPSLGYVDIIVPITNLQDVPDDVPITIILNETSANISKLNMIFYEEKPEEYNETLYNAILNEIYDEVNGTFYNETIYIPYNVTKTRNVWLERNLLQRNEDGQKGEISHQFEEIHLKKGETKRFKYRINFNDIPILPDGSWGSYGKTYIYAKGELYFDFTDSSWWNVSFSFRSIIESNITIANLPFSVNDTFGVGGNIIWTNNKTVMYAYCTVSGCATGDIAIANETDELNWENETSRTGNNVFEIWNESEVLVLHFGEQSGNEANGSTQFDHVCDLVGTFTHNQSGRFGFGMQFNGSDTKCMIPDDAILDLTATGTIEVWILATDPNAFNVIAGKLSTVAGNPGDISYMLQIANEHTRIAISDGGTVNALEGGVDVIDNSWHQLVVRWNSTNLSIYVDGVQDAVTTQIVNAQVNNAHNLSVGHYHTTFYYEGLLDELRIYNRSISPTEIQEHYWNGINNLTVLGTEERFGPVNTSLLHIDFDIIDNVFDSADYVPIANFSFNLSTVNNLTFKGSGNLKKQTTGVESTVSMRITFNEFVGFDQSIRTVSNLNDIGVFTIPFFESNGTIGENTVLVEVKEDGVGSVNISNFVLHIDCNRTNENTTIETEIESRTFNFTGSSQVADSFDINKTVNGTTFIDIHSTFSATGSTTASCHLNDSSVTPSYSRFMESGTDVGSSGINFYDSTDTINSSWNFVCGEDSAETVSSNVTIYDFSLKDLTNNTINAFQNSNTSSFSLGAGTHKIMNESEFIILDGDSIEIVTTVIISSSSSMQTPIIKLNSSDLSENNCSATYPRYLSSNNDIGTVKFYTLCNNLTVNQNYTFDLYAIVESGETLDIFNMSMSGYETTEIDVSVGNLPPIPGEITNPANASEVIGENEFVNWSAFTDPNEQTVTYNITLRNTDETFNATINDSTTNLFTGVNYSRFDFGDYLIMVEGCDPDDLCSNSTVFITVVSFTVTILSPQNTTFNFTNIDLNWNTNIEPDEVLYSLNSASNITLRPETLVAINKINTITNASIGFGMSLDNNFMWTFAKVGGNGLINKLFLNGSQTGVSFGVTGCGALRCGIYVNNTDVFVGNSTGIYLFNQTGNFEGIFTENITGLSGGVTEITSNGSSVWAGNPSNDMKEFDMGGNFIRLYQNVPLLSIAFDICVNGSFILVTDSFTVDIIKYNRTFEEGIVVNGTANGGIACNQSDIFSGIYASSVFSMNLTDVSINTTITGIQGQNNLTVWANISLASSNETTVFFFVDSINPVVNIVQPQNITYCNVNPELNFTFVETNPDSCFYSLNGTANVTLASCDTNGTVMVSGEGGNNVRLCMNDTVGNEGCSQVFWTKDINPPIITIVDPINGSIAPNDILFQFTFNEEIDTAVYSLNGAANVTNNTLNTSWSGNLGNFTAGSHNITVWANDSTCNFANQTTRFFTASIPIVPVPGSVNFNQFLYNFSNPDVNQNATVCFYILNDLSQQNYTCGTFNVTINTNIGENNLTLCWINVSGEFCNETLFNVSIRCSASEVNDTICSGNDFSYIVECRQLGRDIFQFNYENMTYCEFGCIDGNCINRTFCKDRCKLGESTCNGDFVIACILKTDGCRDWTTVNQAFCSRGCQEGRCLDCVDACSIGDAKCVDTTIKFCDDDNGDGCFEFSELNTTECQFGCFETLNETTGFRNVTCNLHSFEDIYIARDAISYGAWFMDYVFNTLHLRVWITLIMMVGFGGIAGIKAKNWRLGLIIMSGIIFASSVAGWMPWVVTIIFLLFVGGVWFVQDRREAD